jgi:hypothetical protein
MPKILRDKILTTEEILEIYKKKSTNTDHVEATLAGGYLPAEALCGVATIFIKGFLGKDVTKVAGEINLINVTLTDYLLEHKNEHAETIVALQSLLYMHAPIKIGTINPFNFCFSELNRDPKKFNVYFYVDLVGDSCASTSLDRKDYNGVACSYHAYSTFPSQRFALEDFFMEHEYKGLRILSNGYNMIFCTTYLNPLMVDSDFIDFIRSISGHMVVDPCLFLESSALYGKLTNRRKELETIRQEYYDAIRELNSKISKIDKKRKRLEDIYVGNWHSKLTMNDLILKDKRIASIHSSLNQIFITTNLITIKPTKTWNISHEDIETLPQVFRYERFLGRFHIVINLDNKGYVIDVWYKNSTLSFEGHVSCCEAPHVFKEKTACMGNGIILMNKSIDDNDYYGAISSALSFLEHANHEDTAGKYYTRLPIIDNGKFVVGNDVTIDQDATSEIINCNGKSLFFIRDKDYVDSFPVVYSDLSSESLFGIFSNKGFRLLAEDEEDEDNINYDNCLDDNILDDCIDCDDMNCPHHDREEVSNARCFNSIHDNYIERIMRQCFNCSAFFDDCTMYHNGPFDTDFLDDIKHLMKFGTKESYLYGVTGHNRFARIQAEEIFSYLMNNKDATSLADLCIAVKDSPLVLRLLYDVAEGTTCFSEYAKNYLKEFAANLSNEIDVSNSFYVVLGMMYFFYHEEYDEGLESFQKLIYDSLNDFLFKKESDFEVKYAKLLFANALLYDVSLCNIKVIQILDTKKIMNEVNCRQSGLMDLATKPEQIYKLTFMLNFACQFALGGQPIAQNNISIFNIANTMTLSSDFLSKLRSLALSPFFLRMIELYEQFNNRNRETTYSYFSAPIINVTERLAFLALSPYDKTISRIKESYPSILAFLRTAIPKWTELAELIFEDEDFAITTILYASYTDICTRIQSSVVFDRIVY